MAGLIGSTTKTLRVQEFRSSGTFTVPPGVKTVELFMVGAGGGGYSSGAAGQPGQLLEIKYDVSGKASCAVLIGAAGTGSSTPTNGGDTIFDGVAIAKGGGHTSWVQSTSSPLSGKAGFAGYGSAGTQYGSVNGARYADHAAANSGAGGSTGYNGGSGYCRVEWYE